MLNQVQQTSSNPGSVSGATSQPNPGAVDQHPVLCPLGAAGLRGPTSSVLWPQPSVLYALAAMGCSMWSLPIISVIQSRVWLDQPHIFFHVQLCEQW